MWEWNWQDWWPVLKSVMSALAVLALVLFFYALAKRGLNQLEKSGRTSPQVVSVFRILLRWLSVSLALLFILSELGILENAWAAILGVLAMVAVGFVAVWSLLSNTLSTLLILIYKPFQMGDRIEIPADELKGRVIDLNLLFTTLREEDGSLLQVPNNFFFQKAIRRIPGKHKLELAEQLKRDVPAE